MTHLVLVLGCHRSGTSLVARSLKCFGVELGRRAEWHAPDNPKGFWEDLDALSLNDLCLQRLGSAWDDPTPVVDIRGWLDEPFNAATMTVTRFLEHRFSGTKLYGLKEPRLCRLLPLWRRAIDKVRCDVSVVHVIRHPMAVAKSLNKRNGIPFERGLALWLEYNRCAKDDVDPLWDRVVVSYDNMMMLPTQQVRRIGEAFDLSTDEAGLKQFARDFVDDTLWHQVEDTDDGLPMEVAVLWKRLSNEVML